MRVTCGVMSARTPSVRPESWSISLQVRRSDRCRCPTAMNRCIRPGRRDQLETVSAIQIEKFAAQFLDAPGLGRKYVGEALGQQPVTHECLPEERLVMRGRRPNEKRLRGVSPLSRCGMFSSLRGIVHGSATRASRPGPTLKPSPIPDPICAGRKQKPLGEPRGFLAGAVRAYLAGTVTGARAAPGSFMNWKKLELGSTTSTSPGFENEAR